MAKRALDVPTLRTAFTLDHPDFECVPTVIQLDRDNFWITGGITAKDGRNAGCFVRRLVRRRFEWTAAHDNFKVDAAFRRRGIAYSHYRKALRAYRQIGCYRVEMFAQEDGTFVWPQFGFRYRRDEDHRDVVETLQRLHRAKTGHCIPSLPDQEFALILFESSDGQLLGAEAARRTAGAHPNGALEMVLDLRDRPTLEYLVARGIFDSEEIE